MKFKQHEKLILELHKKGFSSSEIAKTILGEDLDKLENTSRRVRQIIKKSGVKNFEGVRPKKVLLFDIETAPIQCYTWGIWQQNVNTDFIIKDWYVLCWSAKWLFEDKVISAKLTKKEIHEGDDKRIMQSLWQLLEEADVVIAHNLEKFDKKKSQTRFFKYEMGLPSPYQSIDTLQHLRKKFSINSNRLDYVAKDFLGIAGKMETPKGLWLDCISGDMEALKVMVEYCEQDVRVLEDVYLKLRPYVQPHPNIGLIEDTDAPTCPCCGSHDLKPAGTYHTYVNKFDSFRCGNCKALTRARQNGTKRITKENITVSIPR
ncbi:DNA polymerase I [uncultured Mediterranean phage uvMED]|nr:DNA polymerase I [uncultured Mediterranean phage uvMED]BAR22557.1 DNA polymerase I [uncultured Mediterranean phage uvMED]